MMAPLCALCDRRGRITAATVADHIEPHHGDPDAFWTGKLQSLCKSCHDGAKQAEESGGYMRGADESGMPLDPKHPWSDNS